MVLNWKNTEIRDLPGKPCLFIRSAPSSSLYFLSEDQFLYSEAVIQEWMLGSEE